MTQQTQVDPNKLKQALLQYCPEEVIQQASEEGDYDGTPYWFIYDCLSRLGKSDETNVIRWNKVLRDLGFTSVYDPGNGWIAHNEPTQGVVLDPRIIKQHKMFVNRNPTLQNRRYDIQGLADSIGWSSYFQRESHLQRVYNHPDEKKVRLDVAKTMLRPFLGKTSEEAKEMGYDKALKAAADKVIEILKNTINEASDYSQYEIDAIKFTQEPYEGWNGMGAMITAYADGNQVGQVIFEPTDNDKSKWYATEVEVEDDFQRRGIATTMYDMAKKIAQKANAVIVPSNSQTSDAKGMWKDKKVWEASGYIPSAKEKNDPRFKTALTKDVRPDAIKKNAKAFGFKTSRAGIPPQARADGKV